MFLWFFDVLILPNYFKSPCLVNLGDLHVVMAWWALGELVLICTPSSHVWRSQDFSRLSWAPTAARVKWEHPPSKRRWFLLPRLWAWSAPYSPPEDFVQVWPEQVQSGSQPFWGCHCALGSTGTQAMTCQPPDTALSCSRLLWHERALLFLDLKSVSLVFPLNAQVLSLRATRSHSAHLSLWPFFPSISPSLMAFKLLHQLVLLELGARSLTSLSLSFPHLWNGQLSLSCRVIVKIQNHTNEKPGSDFWLKMRGWAHGFSSPPPEYTLKESKEG